MGWVPARDASRGCSQWSDWGGRLSGVLTSTYLEVGAAHQLGLVSSI